MSINLSKRKRIAIVDIDGTLFNTARRLVATTKDGFFNWKIWQNADQMRTDTPTWVLGAIKHLKEVQGFTIILFSGRGDTNKPVTLEMLEQYDVPYDELFMRQDDPNGEDTHPNGNKKDDYLVKDRMLRQLADHGYDLDDIEIVFDDNPKVIKLWNENKSRYNFFLHQLPFNDTKGHVFANQDK